MKSIAIAVALLALSAGAAHAFTYDGSARFNSDGTSARLTDPEDQLTDGTKPSKSKSGFSMKFSGGPTDNGLGAQSRFLPSRNSAFSSPYGQPNFFDPSRNTGN